MSSNNEDTKLTVPKFTSFRAKPERTELQAPKFSSFKPKDKEPSASASSGGKEKERGRDSRRKRSHHSDYHRDHHHSKRHRTDSHHRHREQPRRSGRSATPDHRPLIKPLRDNTEASRLYIIDTKGDPLIIRYGNLDRSQVPNYYRDGYGRVLGTRGRLVIHRDGPRDQFSLRMPGGGSYAFKDNDGLRSKTWRVRPKPFRIRKQESDNKDEEDDGFLPLGTSKKRKHDHHTSGSSDDEEQPSYRSIEGKAKPSQYDDGDLESESDSSVESDPFGLTSCLKWESVRLSKHVKDRPGDIDAWLELANHQDTLLRAGHDIDRKVLEAKVHSFAEIKLHMLESALSNVSNPQDRIKVLVPLMREGIKVWDSKTITRKWNDLRQEEDKSFALWKTHLDFAMSNMSTFHTDAIKQMHLDRLRHIIPQPGSKPEPKNFREAIYVFLRLTKFVHDCGYKELAIAAWQGVLELNLFRPTQLADQGAQLESLRNFWESEVPRVGESEAQGWAKFVQDGEMGDAPEPLKDSRDPGIQSRDDYKRWASMESSQAEKARVPARTMDEGTEDDPFRVVMFSDIEPFLFIIPRSVLPAVRQQLVDAFLIFLGFPPTFRPDSWTEEAYHDQFLARFTLDLKSGAPKDPWIDENPTEMHRKPPAFTQRPLCASQSLDILFSSTDWFSYLPLQRPENEIEFRLAINVTKQLVHTTDFERLAGYHLALSAKQDASHVKKDAKALLVRYPTNLGLFRAYALAENAKGNHELAAKVLLSATEFASETWQTLKTCTFALWRAWAWMELEKGDKKLAVQRLCSSVDKNLRAVRETTDISWTSILKAQQDMFSILHDSISGGNLDDAEILTECLVLLFYLTAEGSVEPMSTSQGNISAAMKVVHRVSHEFQMRKHQASGAHERILQFATRLWYLHATRGPFRRACLLEFLKGLLIQFPRNTMFLSMFEWADSSLGIVDETRAHLHSTAMAPSEDCLSIRLFSIHHETTRGNTNTTNAAFEHAVSSDTCKFNTSLWISFIRFCSSQRELRSKAKDILFRALRHCPWSKDVMMEAFLTVNQDMDPSELKGMFETMTSKGLRVHVDLDEFLERRENERRAEKSKR
ncbi:hypothetical protein F66182_9504 [Fusarium sp. NRRL 66182]|nr:hypothetical protein F66182_9504 [Fusarium sp. NRRL 66182]